LNVLLNLLDASDEAQGANILNALDDLTGRNSPPALAADATRIRTSVTALAQRIPLLSADAAHVLAHLAKTPPVQPAL